MNGTVFYKMTGSGNDFVMLDGRTVNASWSPAQIKRLCDRRSGAGADGLVILTPTPPHGLRMTYWNSDGSRGAMCGNAALCCGTLAVHLGMMPAGQFCLLTDVGGVLVRTSATGETAEINLPDVDLPEEFSGVPLASGERWMALVRAGVPHLVIRVDDIEATDPETRGRALRHHPALGAEGANVNFIAGPGTAPSQGHWMIRTYERGVESETLACGTGTVAAAVALAARAEATLPLIFRSRGGPQLAVRGSVRAMRATDVWLGGEGRLLYEGVWKGR